MQLLQLLGERITAYPASGITIRDLDDWVTNHTFEIDQSSDITANDLLYAVWGLLGQYHYDHGVEDWVRQELAAELEASQAGSAAAPR